MAVLNIDRRRLPQQRNGRVAQKTDSRKSFVSFVKAVQRKDRQSAWDHYSPVEKAAMAEDSGITGGYLIPLEYTARLLDTIEEESFIWPRATVIPMGAAEVQCPAYDVETAQAAGTSPFFGGVKFTWQPEAASIGETEPTFRNKTLKAWDLIGFARISNQWLMDIGPEGEQYLLTMFGRAAAWYAEYAFLRGTGTAALMPLGILNSPASILVTRAGATAVAAADISGMAKKLLPSSWRTAVWATHPTCLEQIAKLSSYQLNSGTIEPGCAGTLLTRLLFVTEKLPALGTKGDLILMDPRLYLIGNRTTQFMHSTDHVLGPMDIAIDVSEHSRFLNYQTEFRISLRMDGKPWLDAAVTLQDATSTASGYVLLN